MHLDNDYREKYYGKSYIFCSFIHTFSDCIAEDTCTRCEKYSSKLDISRSFVRIFAVKCIIMDNISDKQDVRQQEVQQPRRKQFHGFSMGFLLILLAVVVGVYIVCTFIAGGS